MTAITTKIGADITPLKKTLPEGEALIKASSKRTADDAKKAAKDAEKTHKEMATRAAASLSTVRSGLFQAGNVGDVAATGFEAIAGMGGPLAGIAVTGGLIAKAWYDAAAEARHAHLAFGEMHRDNSFLSADATGYDGLISRLAEIGTKFRDIKREKEKAQGDLGPLGGLIGGTAANSISGAIGEKINDFAKGPLQSLMGSVTGDLSMVQRGVFNKSAKQEQGADLSTQGADRAKLSEEAAAAAEKETDIVEKRVHVSEREADLAASKLATDRSIAAVRAALLKSGMDEADVSKVTASVQQRGALELDAINHKSDLARRDAADELQVSADRLHVSLLSQVSATGGHKAEVERLTKEYEKFLGYANKSGITEEEHLANMKQANAALMQRNTIEAQFQQGRALMTPQEKRAEKTRERRTQARLANSARGEEARAHQIHDADQGKIDTAKNAARNAAERAKFMGWHGPAAQNAIAQAEAKAAATREAELSKGFDNSKTAAAILKLLSLPPKLA